VSAELQTAQIAPHRKATGALDEVMEADTSTPMAVTACRKAFRALAEEMRDIKKRYFYVSPLAEAVLPRWGLKRTTRCRHRAGPRNAGNGGDLPGGAA
jgi:hypothetical protein